MNRRSAFTLIELFIVLVFIAVIVIMAIPVVQFLVGMARGTVSPNQQFSSGEQVGTVVHVGVKGNFSKAVSVDVALQGSGQVWATDVKDNDPVLTAKFRKAARLAKLVTVTYVQPYEENVDYHYNTPFRATDIKLLTEQGGTLEVEVSQKDVDDARRMMGQ